jgi:hypothetical protein
VTLVGIVASRVDKMLLEVIAREEAPFGIDSQLQVDGEQRKEPLPAGGRQV